MLGSLHPSNYNIFMFAALDHRYDYTKGLILTCIYTVDSPGSIPIQFYFLYKISKAKLLKELDLSFISP